MRSAPAASMASISAPSREKSADRIEGAILMLRDIAQPFWDGLCAGFLQGPQGAGISHAGQYENQAGQPDNPRLIPVMGVGEGSANDRIADQGGQHQARQGRLAPILANQRALQQ